MAPPWPINFGAVGLPLKALVVIRGNLAFRLNFSEMKAAPSVTEMDVNTDRGEGENGGVFRDTLFAQLPNVDF